MTIPFFKYQGAGNDFIVIDQREESVKNLSYDDIKALCHRRFGIGADGLMFLKNHPEYDFEMIYHNADGRPGTMCGNGGRCIVAFAKQLGIIDRETNFLAVDGAHYAKISAEGSWVELQMIDVTHLEKDGEAYVLHTGSPHYVLKKEDLQEIDVYTEGKKIRQSPPYQKEGINVNFVEVQDAKLYVRTFERGVEDETYACGTGATAVAMAMAHQKNQIGSVSTPVEVLGGELRIDFDYDGQSFRNVFLCGPALMVFSGTASV